MISGYAPCACLPMQWSLLVTFRFLVISSVFGGREKRQPFVDSASTGPIAAGWLDEETAVPSNSTGPFSLLDDIEPSPEREPRSLTSFQQKRRPRGHSQARSQVPCQEESVRFEGGGRGVGRRILVSFSTEYGVRSTLLGRGLPERMPISLHYDTR